MRYSPQFLDELRARLSVSDVVGRRVKLRKQGREWVGLSPFNQEKSPSFTVNDQKGFFHDFSSGKHGDIFGFVMETEGVTFPEAVERLAGLAGVPVPQMSPESEAREQRRKTLYEVMELAAKFFEAALASRAGARGRGYLADRDLTPAAQVKFRLGYASSERFALKEHLGLQGVSVEDMIEAGLLVHGEDIPVPFDRFRERIMFPISDVRGRVIAFGGRALDKDAPAKYLNSPETPLFHKSDNLYNLAAAKAAARDGAPLVVVEGYIDVIAMVTAGYEAALAPLGTALTEPQLALLWSMGQEPILCFDGDKAGRRAAYRALDMALRHLKPGRSIRFAALPEGQDPDDVARSGGRAALEEVLGGARPLADLLWLRETESGSFDSPERRALLEARIQDVTSAIGDEAVRRYYRQDLARRLRELFEPQKSAQQQRGHYGKSQYGKSQYGKSQYGKSNVTRFPDRNRGGQKPFSAQPAAASSGLSKSSLIRGFHSTLPPREALILQAILNHPWLLHEHAEDISELEFLNTDADRVRRALLDEAARQEVLTPESVRTALAGGGFDRNLARIESAITHQSDWPAKAGAAAGDVNAWWRHVVSLHRKKRTLNKELRAAEQALGSELCDHNLDWLRDVQQRLAVVDGAEASMDGFGAPSGRPARNF